MSKLQSVSEIYLRTILSLLNKVKDLAEQKALTQKELQASLNLSKIAQDDLLKLGDIAEEYKLSDHTQSLNIDEDKMIPEFSMYNKYVCAIKFRKAVIAVIAANRLSRKFSKERIYGTPIPRHISHPILQGGSRITSMISHIGIIDKEQFPERLMSDVISKAIKNLSKEEELNVVVESLDEMCRNKEQQNSILVFLADGLKKLKSKYSWMHLGVPLEYILDDPLNVEGSKNYMVESAKRIENGLMRLKEIPQLMNRINYQKEREESLMKQLTIIQSQAKEYEGKINQLIKELKNKENTMVTADKYEALVHELEAKGRNMSSLTTEIVRL